MDLSRDSNMRRARLDLVDFNLAVAEASLTKNLPARTALRLYFGKSRGPMAFSASQRVKLCEMSSRGTHGTGAVYRANNTKLDHDFGTSLLPETRAKQ